MPKYRFEQIAINSTEKRKPTELDMATYIGLEHMDSHSLVIKRWGSDVPIIGEKLIMKKGDVLLGKRNAYLRRAAIAPFDGLFSAHGMVLRPKTEVVDEEFFPIFIASDYFFDEAIRISVGSLSPTINWKDLKDVEFNLPPLEEQRKLAKTLHSVIRTIDSYQDLLEKQDLLIKSQFIEMFGKIKERRTLADLCCKITDGSHAPSKGIDKSNYLMLSSQNIFDELVLDDVRYLTKEDFIKENRRTNIEEGDLLLTIVGTIGRTHVVKKNEKYVFQRSVCVIKPKADVLNSVFLESYLKTDEGFNQLDNGGHGTTQRGIYLKNVNNLLIPLANMNDQLLFVSFKTQIDKSKFMHNIAKKGETYAYI